MGKYINRIGITYEEKVKNLAEIGTKIAPPVEWCENLVCLVDNGPFAAAAWCYDRREFREFSANDGRRKCWFIVPDAPTLAQ